MALRVLVTGASGFIGSRLCPALIEAGHHVSAMTRSPEKYTGQGDPVAADVSDPDTLPPVLAGIDAAYYLVHSLDSGDFVERDAQAAKAFGAAAAAAGSKADHLPRWPRRRRREVVAAPEIAATGGGTARRGWRSGHGAAGSGGHRQRRDLMGDHPAAGRPPARSWLRRDGSTPALSRSRCPM